MVGSGDIIRYHRLLHLRATLVFFSGSVFERFGARLVVSAGTTAMASGVLLLAFVTHPWQVYVAFAVMSLGWAAMSGAAINIIVASWFDKRRGLTVSLALNGASAGGVLIAPLLIHLIGRFDLPGALICVVGLMLVAVLPIVAIVLRPKRPDERDQADADSPRGASSQSADQAWQISTILRSRNFLTISIPFALGLTAQVGFLTHQVAYLSAAIGTVAAGWAVSLTTFSAVMGRLLTGLFVDKIDRRATAFGNFCIQILGMVLLLAHWPITTLYLGCVLFGLGGGNMISLPSLIVHQEFPKQHFSRIVALVVAINQFTFAFGPGLLGYLYRAAGNYAPAFIACIVMQSVAAVIVVTPLLGRIIGRQSGKPNSTVSSRKLG